MDTQGPAELRAVCLCAHCPSVATGDFVRAETPGAQQIQGSGAGAAGVGMNK